MSLILSGSDGLSDIDGSAATPAIRGTDANTGIFFPAADTIAFAEGGAEAMRIDSSGNLCVGSTSSLSSAANRVDLTVNGTTTSVMTLGVAGTATSIFYASSGLTILGTKTASPLSFYTSDTERARIDTSGSFIVGTTAEPNGTTGGSAFMNASVGRKVLVMACTITSNANIAEFANPNGVVGSIATNGSATAYNTSSDYRLKNTIAPMTGALAKVALLKPCTYKWNVDGEDGQGFIAHELAEVVPQCVSGGKDAVDKDGKPVYQGIDVSFLVATLTSAIQELNTKFEAYKASHP